MSVEHMAMVFAADGLEGSEKLLLLAYTNFTDPHGYCWPGEERLAEDTGTSVSTVRRTKKKLIAKNLVKSIRRQETSNLARVNLPLLASMARPRKAYDDNEVERLSFGSVEQPAPEDGSDLRTVHSDLSGEAASDLRTVHSDLSDRSDCSVTQVNLTGPTGQSDLQSLSDPPEGTISRPSVREESASEGTDGGTDGSAVPHQIERNPGVDLLSAIGAQQPEFLLTGQTLQDQGMAVAGMLLEGWTREQLRQVIAGRPLPDNIHKTVGAVIARRLRDALVGPPPYVGQQFKADAFPKDAPTPVPAAWDPDAIVPRAHQGECQGDDGLCGRPLKPGEDLCPQCQRARERQAAQL